VSDIAQKILSQVSLVRMPSLPELLLCELETFQLGNTLENGQNTDLGSLVAGDLFLYGRLLAGSAAVDNIAYYSPARLVQQHGFDSLKIDRSFIHDMEENADQSVIEAIAHMARGLKLEMVAEGVEEEFQLRYLQELNCPVIQGFYYSQAVPAEEARQLIDDGASIIGRKALRNSDSHKSSMAGKNKLKATAG
jgi:hypothetical protein